MHDDKRLETLKIKIQSSAAEGITNDEARFLLEVLATQEAKAAVLSRHVLELTEELENVKMDFGGGAR
jgi:hypothetical protein